MRLQQHGAGPRAAFGGDGGEHHRRRLGHAKRLGVRHPPGELRHGVTGHRGLGQAARLGIPLCRVHG